MRGEVVATAGDWAVAAVTFLRRAWRWQHADCCGPHWWAGLGIPAIVFGLLGMRLGGGDMWRFAHAPKEKMFWWYEHLQGMMASYIAAWTAFFFVVTVEGSRTRGGCGLCRRRLERPRLP